MIGPRSIFQKNTISFQHKICEDMEIEETTCYYFVHMKLIVTLKHMQH